MVSFEYSLRKKAEWQWGGGQVATSAHACRGGRIVWRFIRIKIRHFLWQDRQILQTFSAIYEVGGRGVLLQYMKACKEAQTTVLHIYAKNKNLLTSNFSSPEKFILSTLSQKSCWLDFHQSEHIKPVLRMRFRNLDPRSHADSPPPLYLKAKYKFLGFKIFTYLSKLFPNISKLSIF